MFKLRLNISDGFIIYFLGMLYIQILELFIPLKVSKLFMIFLVFTIIINIYKKRVKLSLSLFIYEFLCILYLIIYYCYYYDNFSNAAVAIIFSAIAPFIVKNVDYSRISYWNIIENIILVYLCINISLYIFNVNDVFQIDGGMRFKGALPHANMLGLILMSILILFFYSKGIKSNMITLLTLAVLLLNGSRTYIIFSLIIVGLKLIKEKSKVKNYRNTILIGCPIILLLIALWDRLLQSSSILFRFSYYLFSDNGRSILMENMNIVSSQSNIVDKIFGFNMGGEYLLLSPTYYSHGFAENSYISIYMLFGYIGIMFLLLFVHRYIRMCRQGFKPLLFTMVFIVVLMSMYFQDTILSTQGASSIFGALSIMNTYKEKLI